MVYLTLPPSPSLSPPRKVKAAVSARAALAKAKAAHHSVVTDAAARHAHVAAMKPIWFRVRTDWGDLQVINNLLTPLNCLLNTYKQRAHGTGVICRCRKGHGRLH